MKGDKTTTLALIAGAVILAVVGIKSFLDYKMAELESRPPSETAATEESGPEDESAYQASIDQMPRSVLPPIPEALLEEPAAPDAGANTPTLSSSPSEVDAYRARLEKLKAEGSGSLPAPASNPSSPTISPAPITGPGGPIPGPGLPTGGGLPPMPAEFQEGGTAPAVATPAEMAPGTPRSALSAIDPSLAPNTGPVPPPEIPTGPNEMPLVGPVGDSPGAAETAPPPPVQTAAEIAALEEQVRRQPALAKVLAYDPEWAVLVLNSGAESNIKPEMRLAVRRGAEILGFIKVTEVEANQSIAELMSHNKFSPTARKPQPGDDIIAFNLF